MILILCPSFGRPENAVRLRKSLIETRASDESDVIFVLDESDPSAIDYKRAGVPNLLVWPGTMVERTNIAAKAVYSVPNGFDTIAWMGDDMVFRTKGWDDQIKDALKDSLLVYTNDLHQGAAKAEAVFMRKKVVKALGWLCPPWSKHLYVDDAYVRLSERLGGRYLEDVIIEHMHPYAGKAEWDDRYLEYNTPSFDKHDGDAYRKWLDSGITVDVNRVLWANS